MTRALRVITVGAHHTLGAALRAPFTRCCFAQPRAPRSARHFSPSPVRLISTHTYSTADLHGRRYSMCHARARITFDCLAV
eukprot:2691892-Pleurochrysis_carterae.AAC.1